MRIFWSLNAAGGMMPSRAMLVKVVIGLVLIVLAYYFITQVRISVSYPSSLVSDRFVFIVSHFESSNPAMFCKLHT